MMRTSGYSILGLLIAGLLVAGVPAGAAELNIGDPAPKLEVSKWVKGKPVDLAAIKGKKIVVLDFWATWCGPCIESIPHLTALQRDLAAKDVVIIGVTARDPGNTLKMVEKFVARWGDKMAYSIAFDKEEKAYKAYMEATGQSGIPTAFVIDKSGRVAWIGHPTFGLDEVLEEVIAGKHDIELAKKVCASQHKIDAAWMEGDFDTFVKACNDWIDVKPGDVVPYLSLFRAYAYGLEDDAKALAAAEKAVAMADKKSRVLGDFAVELAGWADKDVQRKLALKAAARAIELDPTNTDGLVARFMILARAGQTDRATKASARAIDAMHNDDEALGQFAVALSSPEWEDRFIDVSLRAVDLAIKAGQPDNARHLLTKFRIMAASSKDHRGIEELGRLVIKKGADDPTLLNEFAWGLLTEEDTEGKFNELALAAAQQCSEASGGENWMYLDTLALAKFETGARKDAVALQEKAIELCDNGMALIELRQSLKRYQEQGL